MNVDFSAVLVILTSLSGIVWLFGVLFFVDKKNRDENGELVLPAIVDFARSFFSNFLYCLDITFIYSRALQDSFGIHDANLIDW